MSTFIPNTDVDRRAMLDAIGAGSVEELFDVIPAAFRFPRCPFRRRSPSWKRSASCSGWRS